MQTGEKCGKINLKGGIFLEALWLILAVVLAVIEAATVQLVSVWFACGAVCAFLAAFVTDSLPVQAAVFVISSVLFLVISRKFVKKALKNKVATNSDSLIGQSAVLTETVDNDLGTGTLKKGGIVWTARSENGERIEEGTKVKIVKIEGVKLIVRKED